MRNPFRKKKQSVALVFPHEVWVAEDGSYGTGGIMLIHGLGVIKEHERDALLQLICEAPDNDRFSLTKSTLEYWGYDYAELVRE